MLDVQRLGTARAKWTVDTAFVGTPTLSDCSGMKIGTNSGLTLVSSTATSVTIDYPVSVVNGGAWNCSGASNPPFTVFGPGGLLTGSGTIHL